MKKLIALSALCIIYFCLVGQSPMEVEGIIHTKAGGIKFPDDTVQKTAATNDGRYHASDQRLIGYFVIAGINGPLTIPGIVSNAFPMYSMDFMGKKSSADSKITGGLRRDGSCFYPVEVCTDISFASPRLWEVFAGNEFVTSLTVHFLKDDSGTMVDYYEIVFSLARIVLMNEQLVYTGSGNYSHKQILRFDFETMTWTFHEGQIVSTKSWTIESEN